jgi:branched-chain amino acid transport system substrate-binding protein
VARSEVLQEISGQYLQSQGFHRLAVFDSAATAPALDAFKRGYKGEVVEIRSPPSAMDFASSMARITDAKADAGYLLHKNGMAVQFLLQFAAGHHKEQLPLFAPAETLDQPILAASAPAALDLFSIGGWSDDLDTPANKRLVTDYEAEYGRPVSSRAAAGYDAAMLLDAAIRAVDRKINDLDGVRAALKRVEFSSTRGVVHFDNDQMPLMSYVARQVASDSRGRLINEQRGLAVKDPRDAMARDCALPPSPPPPPQKVK